jgi:SAM-dependent methyltransferase
MTHRFSELFGEVYALDISPVMIESAQRYWPDLRNVHFREGTGRDLTPLADQSVDFVFSFYVLNHVTDTETVLNYIRETSRVLKPDGLALLHFRIKPSALQRLFLIRWAMWKQQTSQGYWWNRGIKRNSRTYKTGLMGDFARNESWRGCEVPWKDARAAIRSSGSRLIRADFVRTTETHFVFVGLRKKSKR